MYIILYSVARIYQIYGIVLSRIYTGPTILFRNLLNLSKNNSVKKKTTSVKQGHISFAITYNSWTFLIFALLWGKDTILVGATWHPLFYSTYD